MSIKGRHLLVLVAMCGLLASCVGLVTNVAGLFFSPVADELGIMKGEVSLILTICNISFAIGGLFAPRLMGEKIFKFVLIGATAVLAGCTAALSMCHNIVAMYALCVARGFAAGLMGFVFVTSVLNRWFVEGIGLATSIAMGCSGIAGAAFTPVVSSVIAGSGWRTGYLLLGALTVVLNLPAILFLPSIDPQASGNRALGEKEELAAAATEKTSAPTKDAAPISILFLALVFAFGLLVSATTALPQHFPGIAEIYGHAAVGATMLSVCMVANTGGKIIFGILVDRIGNRLTTFIYLAVVAVATFMLMFVKAPLTLAISALLFGACYALGTVAITMITRDTFGVENYDRTYPIIGLGGNMANAVFSSVVGFMYDFSGSYDSTLIMFAIMLAVSAAIVVFVYSHNKKAAAAAA